jgi:hypothetical protein
LLTVVVLLPVFRGCLALLHLFSAAFNAALDCCDAGLLLQVGVEIGSPNFAPGTGGAAQPPDGVVSTISVRRRIAPLLTAAGGVLLLPTITILAGCGVLWCSV